MNNLIYTIKILLSLYIFFFAPTVVYAQTQKEPVLDINLEYRSDQVNLVSVIKRDGFLPDYLNQPNAGYTLQILDKELDEIFKLKFNFPLEIITEDFSNSQQTAGSVQKLEQTNYTITIPSTEIAQKLVILDPEGRQLLVHDLSIIVDPNLPQRGATHSKTPFKVTSPIMLFASSIAAILVIVLGLFLYYKHKHLQLPESPKIIYKDKMGKKLLIIISAMSIIVLTSFLLIYLNNKGLKQTSTPSPSNVPTERLAELAPFRQDFGTLVYYRETDSFSVIIEEADFNTNKEKAINWFLQSGVDDICSIKLEFVRNSARHPSSPEERTPTGCQISPEN